MTPRPPHRPHPPLLWVALCLWALWGCEDYALQEERLQDTAPDAAAPDLDAVWAWVVESLVVEVCDLPWTCPEVFALLPPTAGRFPSLEACRAEVRATLQDPAGTSALARPPIGRDALGRALTAQTVTWDADAAAACLALSTIQRCALAERSEAWAQGQWPADSVCARALVGAGLDGDPCDGGWACAPGLRCLPDPSAPDPDDPCAPKRCAPRSRSLCVTGTVATPCGPLMGCDGAGQCVDEGRAGDACDPSTPCAFDLGLTCGDDGRCVGVSDLPRQPLGAPCAPWPPWTCAAGLRCVAGACVAVAVNTTGQPCHLTGDAPTTCAGDSACWLSQYTAQPATCALAAPLGAPCDYDAQCPWRALCSPNTRRCVPAPTPSACP